MKPDGDKIHSFSQEDTSTVPQGNVRSVAESRQEYWSQEGTCKTTQGKDGSARSVSDSSGLEWRSACHRVRIAGTSGVGAKKILEHYCIMLARARSDQVGQYSFQELGFSRRM